MKSVRLFFGPNVVRCELLSNWLSQFGYIAEWVSGLDNSTFRRKWQSLVEQRLPGFYIDYPIEANQDLKTIDDFINDVLKHGGPWYYAPRPNDYLDVSVAAMVGMSPAFPLGAFSVMERLKPFVRMSIERLPRSWQKPVFDFAIHIYRHSHSAKQASKENSKLNDVSELYPDVKVPASLERFNYGWKSWRASRQVLQRDLIDRVSFFFPHPQNIHVIVLNQCNLKCVMCPYHSPKYKPHHTSGYFSKREELELDVFKSVAEYAGKHNIALQFGQIEEVLMHKKFFQILEIAKKSGVTSMHVTTNGVLLDEDKAKLLADSGVTSVMFSIDSVTPEVYREIRGSDLALLERNIKNFIPLAKRKGIKVMASFILQPQAISEREQFLDKWRALGIDKVTFYVLTESDVKTGKWIRNGDEMYNKGERYPCASPWTQTVLFPSGEISLCCKTMSDIGWRGMVSVGTVPKTSMPEVWQGEGYQTVRGELLNNSFDKFPVCIDCEIWSASTSLVEEGNGYRRTFNETMETYEFK